MNVLDAFVRLGFPSVSNNKYPLIQVLIGFINCGWGAGWVTLCVCLGLQKNFEEALYLVL